MEDIVTRLLVVDPRHQRYQPSDIEAFASYLHPHDLVVLNDAATLPASLHARATRTGAPVEIRLLGPERDGRFQAVLFGEGDYRTRTEHRTAPVALGIGDQLTVSSDLHASVMSQSALSARLVELQFDARAEALWTQLYAHGRPVQYADQREPLPLWSVQTLYAARPWAAEMPSAGRPLSMRVFAQLARRGVKVATLTHAAGLSATGDPAIDRALPLPERYDIPAATVHALQRARQQGARVIAVGTSVVRALESAALRGDGHVLAGEALSTLRIDAKHRMRVVDGLLTGIHTPEESHFDLLRAFVDEPLLQKSAQHALEHNYRLHEFGDASLILSGALAEPAASAA
jgi:S-adenosylmethionine:tRNA ribosyltransferase-isomerase